MNSSLPVAPIEVVKAFLETEAGVLACGRDHNADAMMQGVYRRTKCSRQELRQAAARLNAWRRSALVFNPDGSWASGFNSACVRMLSDADLCVRVATVLAQAPLTVLDDRQISDLGVLQYSALRAEDCNRLSRRLAALTGDA